VCTTKTSLHEAARKWSAILLIGSLTGFQAAAPQAAVGTNVAKVRKGTALKFVTLQPIDSTKVKVGDDVPLRLARPLVHDSVTLLAPGEVMHGRVTKLKRAKPSCRDAEVEWRLDRITFADASTAKVKISFINPSADFDVPAELPDHEISPWVWSFLGPFAVATAPVILPGMAADGISRRCSSLGNKYLLPANATVAVMVAEDHNVRY
jgi:hypothetical protein